MKDGGVVVVVVGDVGEQREAATFVCRRDKPGPKLAAFP